MTIERLPMCGNCYQNAYGDKLPPRTEARDCSACDDKQVPCALLPASVDEYRDVRWPAPEGVAGINRRCYPSEYLPNTGRNDQTTVITVLVASSPLVGEYSCYNGIGSPEFVRRHGDKIPFEEAQVHFTGQLERERYRN